MSVRTPAPESTLRLHFGLGSSAPRHPFTVSVAPGPRHWEIFEGLVVGHGISGSDSTDAYLAALAMEHGCEWWSTDEGFARFDRLRWRNVIAG